MKRLILGLIIMGILSLFAGCGNGEMMQESLERTEAETIEDMPAATSEVVTANDVKYFTPQNPSWEYYLAGEGVNTSLTVPVLTEISSKQLPVGEELSWFAEYGLEKFSFPYSDGVSYQYSIYGERGENDYESYILQLMDVSNGALLSQYDFSNYQYADEYQQEDYDFIKERICWAKAQDGVLYIAIAHNTYAASAPHNGYLTAIDIASGEVIWKSAPLTCNSWSCALVNGGIVCGYGFTDEDDYLNVIDIHDGTIAQQIPLKTMAEYIVEKENQIYVRTYNMEYIFAIQ